MVDARRLVAALKQVMKSRGVRYDDLARQLGLSTATVKRMLSTGRIGLDRIDAICRVLETDLYELARLGKQSLAARPQLSPTQEDALAADPRLLLVFHLLCNDWDAASIGREFALDNADLTLHLATLDRLRLIELLAGNRLRLKIDRNFVWRADGPVRKRYAASALTEFLKAGFDGGDAVLRFEIREISAASSAAIVRKIDKLVDALNTLAENDAEVPVAERRSFGILLAARPWVFSLLDSLRAEVPGRKAR